MFSNTNIDYENYSNSIYNVNKKKNNNKKNFQGYNNRFNKKGSEENEDDENEGEEVATGFRSAITEINKKVFKNKNNNGNNNSSYNDRREEDEPIYNGNLNNKNTRPIENENNNINNANKTGTYKKFNPPIKSNANEQKKIYDDNRNKDKGEKDKELDEKLKGFDKNVIFLNILNYISQLIEFIESEILSYNPNVKWEDIAGLQFAKKTIKEIIIWPLLRPDIFNGIRRPPKGLLLFGPPGTGKTMIAKAIASESNSKFFNISASSLMSKWIGESEKLVRTLFALASYYQPSVVFIDEIDSILTARSENECEASRRLKTEFLVQLDGAGTNQDDRILIIGATNRPQEIDDAFIRRLAKRLYIPLPDFDSRMQLIKTVINKEKEKSKYEMNEEELVAIVKKSKGYSGSDMMGVCREAAMMPIRSIEDINNIQLDNLRGINLNDFCEALNLVKPSVSEKTIAQYVNWNKDFGSFQFDEKDNDN